ncbi:hypothetical protein G9P44_000994 [Scheffersomyces stipitis]|nr:hypothetical protein G9P44_000994 [Scheffersomyces stipitis]
MNEPERNKRDIQISKAMSYLLRHAAVKEKLAIDEDGYVQIADLLKHQRLKTFRTSTADLERVVQNDNKQRYTIKDNAICANQGHSIKSVGSDNLELLTLETIPSEVYHGTYRNKLGLIYSSGGLNRLRRNHIHMTSKAYSVKSGIRYNANVLIYIDVAKCMEAGIKFYKSLNDVILSEGDENGYISWKYFDKVVEVKTGEKLDTQEYEK